jgi:hypothetical protein
MTCEDDGGLENVNSALDCFQLRRGKVARDDGGLEWHPGVGFAVS